jgi:dynein assembly factor 5
MTSSAIATALDELTKKQQRNINCLTDPNRSTRRRALGKFVKEFQSPPTTKNQQRDVHASFFIQSLQAPLLTCLSDEVEKCRELSGTLLTHFVNHVLTDAADSDAMLTLFSLLLPILQNRIGSVPFAEPTEEIRFMLIELLGTMLAHPTVSDSPKLIEQGPDVLAVYARALQDSFPDVKKASAIGVSLLSKVAPSNLHSNMEKCIIALIENLGHQHSRVRCLTLQAMASLLPAGAEGLERLMNDKVLTALRSVSADRSGSVRKVVVTTASTLCTDLPMAERFHADLLPLVLGGIADDADDVKEHAARTMCSLGSTVAETTSSNATISMATDEMKQSEAKQAAASEKQVSTNKQEATKTDAGEEDPAEAARLAALVPTLGAPFDKVIPHPKAKKMVQHLLPQLLPPVLRELKEWTVARRSHAAGVLSAILVFAEGHAVAFIPEILAALGNACRDDEVTVAGRAFSCAELLGLFLPLEAVLNELLPIIGEYDQHVNKMISPQERSGLLMILSAVMTSAQLSMGSSQSDQSQSNSTTWTKSTADLMKNVVSTLALPVVCESEAIEVQSQLVEVMLDVISVGCADVSAKNTRTTSFALLVSESETNLQFVRILVQLQATPGDEEAPCKVRSGATSTMLALAEACGYDSTSHIFHAHFEKLLRVILAGRNTDDNDDTSVNVNVNVAQEVQEVAVPKEKISTMARRAGKWEKDTPQRRLFDTLVRQSLKGSGENPVGLHLHLILPILETTLQVTCDPDLRMNMLALISTMLDNAYIGQVCRERDAYGGTMLQRLFLPNAIWRVGRVASSVRKITMRCVSTLLRHRLVTSEALEILWKEPNQLGTVMKSCLDDDEPMTRQLTALSLMNIFEVMPKKMDMETCMVRKGGGVVTAGALLLVLLIVALLLLLFSLSLTLTHSLSLSLSSLSLSLSLSMCVCVCVCVCLCLSVLFLLTLSSSFIKK